MAMMRTAVATRNAQADQIKTKIDAGAGNGTIKIYTGSAPAHPEDAATGTLLGTLTFAKPSAPAASGGVLTFNAITQDDAADATGRRLGSDRRLRRRRGL